MIKLKKVSPPPEVTAAGDPVPARAYEVRLAGSTAVYGLVYSHSEPYASEWGRRKGYRRYWTARFMDGSETSYLRTRAEAVERIHKSI